MIDTERRETTRVLAAPVVPDLPLGLVAPQLHGDVGWDLVAAQDVTIGPGNAIDVMVNVRLQLPEGWYADVRNRSSMARRGLYVDQNLIDGGYRGPMFVFIRNMALPAMRADQEMAQRMVQENVERLIVPGQQQAAYTGPNVFTLPADMDPNAVTIAAGERIAQLVFHRASRAWVHPVPEIEINSERGEAGFGSTGT